MCRRGEDCLHEVVLISVMHDPEGWILKPLKEGIAGLKDYYHTGYIALSDQTDNRIKEELERAGYTVFTIKKKGAAYARRSILQLVNDKEHQFFHYCDLDRMIN